MEKISILIPVYNREMFIEEALQSAINQTYSNLDIIIYNDGSTDKSLNIIKSFNDSRIKIINNEKNNGIGYARNVLLNACCTKYACWLDSDDIILKNKVQMQADIMSKDKIIFTNWVWYNFGKRGWYKNNNNTSAKAFASVMFPVNKTIQFNTKLQIGGEDWDWLKRMNKIYPTDLIEDTLYLIRYHTDRIGHWKKKFRTKFSSKDIKNLTYAELLNKYRKG